MMVPGLKSMILERGVHVAWNQFERRKEPSSLDSADFIQKRNGQQVLAVVVHARGHWGRGAMIAIGGKLPGPTGCIGTGCGIAGAIGATGSTRPKFGGAGCSVPIGAAGLTEGIIPNPGPLP